MEEGVEGRGMDGRGDGEGGRELGDGRGERLGPTSSLVEGNVFTVDLEISLLVLQLEGSRWAQDGLTIKRL